MIEFIHLPSCFLIKVKYTGSNKKSSKLGFRLEKMQHMVELFSDSVDTYNKWYELLRRYCIL